MIADIFDVQISSQDGKHSCTGYVATQTEHSTNSQDCEVKANENVTIKKDDIKARHLDLGAVTIHRFSGPKKPDVPEYLGKRSVPT